MSQALLIEVEFHEPRFHGRPEWPPSPARLFQALVSGASRGATVPASAQRALRWLEQQGPPTIAAPPASPGQLVSDFVPNNDLDAAKAGDLTDVAPFRTAKRRRPWLMEGHPGVMYGWYLGQDSEEAGTVCALAEDLYQLGRGIDPAWARGSLVPENMLSTRLEAHGGKLHRPMPGGVGGLELPCPRAGTFDSLVRRFEAGRQRLTPERFDGKDWLVFQQLPRPLIQQVPYDASAHRALFELRHPAQAGAFLAEPLVSAVQLTIQIRDAAATRLREHLPDLEALIDLAIVGRAPDPAQRLDASRRARIRPLPSIGHRFTDPSIRRILVEVPGHCPLEAADVFWAFGGLQAPNGGLLTRTPDHRMLEHYGTKRGSQHWRSVTPVALPESAARRRMDRQQSLEDSKSAREREQEESRAVHAVQQALRHEGVDAQPRLITVRREPFGARGSRAEAFAADRFAKERLWHVEIRFDRLTGGPLSIGDGRFLGLGLLEPAWQLVAGFAWRIRAGRTHDARPSDITRALRRAIMARTQAVIGSEETLPGWFTGHQAHGEPSHDHRHLFYAYDPSTDQLAVLAPHLVLRTEPGPTERRHLRQLERAVGDLSLLRAGPAGLLALEPEELPEDLGRVWQTVTPYLVRRHAKKRSAADAVREDVLGACVGVGLPRPNRITVSGARGAPGKGLQAHVTLEFRRTIAGPILLGRSRHKGGGWFRPVPTA